MKKTFNFNYKQMRKYKVTTNCIIPIETIEEEIAIVNVFAKNPLIMSYRYYGKL